MKAGIVGVPLEDIEKVAKSISGITVLHQRGFVKITGNVPNKAVYPTNTKIVSEVHFSGFAVEPKQKLFGLIPNPKHPKPTKRVTHFLDQREGVVSREQILSNLELMLKSMISTEVVEPVKFEAPIASKPASEPTKEAKVIEMTIPKEPEPEANLEEIVAIAAEQPGDEENTEDLEQEMSEEDEIREFLDE